MILDGADPTRVLQRSAVPLLSPVQGWELGAPPFECNVGSVVFLEAAVRVESDAGDLFDVYFGGSDAVVGTARVRVTAASA